MPVDKAIEVLKLHCVAAIWINLHIWSNESWTLSRQQVTFLKWIMQGMQFVRRQSSRRRIAAIRVGKHGYFSRKYLEEKIKKLFWKIQIGKYSLEKFTPRSICAFAHSRISVCIPLRPSVYILEERCSQGHKSLRTLCDGPEMPTEWKSKTGTDLQT